MEEKPYKRHGKNTVEAISPVPVEQTVNPFSHTINFNNVDKIKIFVLSIVALLPRAIGVILCLVISWLLACIGLWGLSQKELREKPMVGWRRTLRAVISQIMVWLFYCSGFNKVRVRGRQATAREAPILALASHSTFYDALVVVFLGSPSIVAKEDVKKVPFFGTLINFTQPIYVVREDPDSRVNTIKEMVRRATSEDDWQQILIFPEGTCTNRKALITFKPGAFYPGVPVQPVCIKYPNKLDTLSWTWDGPGALQILWYTMTQFVTNAEIEFLPPYVPSEEEKQNPKLFADNVRREMAKCLEAPVVDYSYEDCRLMMGASKLGLPEEVGLVEAANLKTKYGIDQKELETTMLQRFAKIANRKEGVIRLEDFAAYLQIPVTNPCLHQVFRAYDKDSSGYLTFKKFVIGQMSISLPAITEENLETTFELLDRGTKGYIDFGDVTYAMEKSFAGSIGVLKPPLFGVGEETKISYDDFVATVNERPEYAKFFEIFRHSYAPAS